MPAYYKKVQWAVDIKRMRKEKKKATTQATMNHWRGWFQRFVCLSNQYNVCQVAYPELYDTLEHKGKDQVNELFDTIVYKRRYVNRLVDW